MLAKKEGATENNHEQNFETAGLSTWPVVKCDGGWKPGPPVGAEHEE